MAIHQFCCPQCQTRFQHTQASAACPVCGCAASPVSQPGGLLGTIASIAAGAAVTVVGARLLRNLSDEEFSGPEFPARVRREIIDEHWACHRDKSWNCPGHGRDRHRVRKMDLTVDHIIPLAEGGRTSRANAQVMCQRCNSSKGASMGVTDWLRGRSGGTVRRKRR